ncbi:hypothetical protein RJP56_18760 [Shewanella baltica]|uniref:hypothetical protein n=1 Tax=Shewanella baltica TaxID=62322 RepID=UPI00287145AC|nr:hypothetical protein [Shewanella baltica]MDR9768106.1 hypothetical protein [Shewanella baltica]
MEKFLYLTEPDWAKSWIEGGEIPINLASSYLSDSREGIMTPDENLIHESAVPIPSLRQHGYHFENVKNLTFTGNYSNGVRLPDLKNANYYTEDGLILSFCNHFDEKTAERFGKSACVRILNIDTTRKAIDKQIGCKGIMKSCEYTVSHQRNHFLKSIEDKWQDEFRIFWKSRKTKWVKAPQGTAELVWLKN